MLLASIQLSPAFFIYEAGILILRGQCEYTVKFQAPHTIIKKRLDIFVKNQRLKNKLC